MERIINASGRLMEVIADGVALQSAQNDDFTTGDIQPLKRILEVAARHRSRKCLHRQLP